MPFNEETPTRADILKHSHGNIHSLNKWLDTLDLPVGAKEAIYSDLESYDYTEPE
jgi:hypothetical protein